MNLPERDPQHDPETLLKDLVIKRNSAKLLLEALNSRQEIARTNAEYWEVMN